MEACSVVVLNKDHVLDTVKLFHTKSSVDSITLVAENYFSSICIEHDLVKDDDVEMALDDGYAEFDDGWSVWITWPLIEEVK